VNLSEQKKYKMLIKFPHPDMANQDGLLAIGGNLEPETLLSAYRQGIFPWSVKPISWWSPDPRAIFEIASFRLSSRMERAYKNCRFTFSLDQAFPEVINGCATSGSDRESTWISREFIRAYIRLHEAGFAHSAEAWLDGKLVGGVYGVALGGFFAGESMFHKETNASTLCLRFLMEHLNQRGFILFDSQVASPHTFRLGVKEISRDEYLCRLKSALPVSCTFK